MKRNIFLDGKEIEYELTYKKVKNINLRIHRDGKITVSANKRIPMKFIEAFLTGKSDFITSALERSAKIKAPTFSYDDGDALPILGEKYTVRNERANKIKAVISEDSTVILYTPDGTPQSRIKAVLRLYERVCLDEVNQLCTEVFEQLGNICSEMPQIKFRKARSRWGSCYSTQNKIVLNKLLAAAPPECIKYVIYHEFIHFVQPNHSKKFYEELEKYVPEHRELKKRLNSYSYILDFPTES